MTGAYNLSNVSARNGELAEAMKRVNAAVANSVVGLYKYNKLNSIDPWLERRRLVSSNSLKNED